MGKSEEFKQALKKQFLKNNKEKLADMLVDLHVMLLNLYFRGWDSEEQSPERNLKEQNK